MYFYSKTNRMHGSALCNLRVFIKPVNKQQIAVLFLQDVVMKI